MGRFFYENKKPSKEIDEIIRIHRQGHKKYKHILTVLARIQHRESNIEHQTSNIEYRAFSIMHRASNIEHRTSNIDYRESSTQNKPNFRKTKMNIIPYMTRNYNEKWTMDSWSKQTQSNPISKGALAQSYGLRR